MTFRSLAMLARVTVEFFWGEAAWGMTHALRQIRWLRMFSALISILSISLIIWSVVGYGLAAADDNYSFYEGKVLEERVAELQRKISDQNESIRKILIDSNTQTLLAVRMQNQIDQMQHLLDAGIKVLGGVVAAVVASLLRDLVQIKLRRERAHIGRRREGE